MRPVADIVDLAARLIRLPTQGGIDPAGPALSEMAGWLAGAGLAPELLAGADGRPIAVVATVEGARPGPAWCLDACIDTAPVGDRAAWTVDPFGGTVADGRLWGRGAADCRIAVATFAHLAAALSAERERMAGSLRVLFDADEHTGRFGGVRAFAERYPDTAGVFIGYPENDQINLGARGFWRARIAVFGEAAHSGAAGLAGANAAVRAAALVRDLAALGLPDADPAADFPLPPKATVTSIEGGSGFSVVPDRVTVGLDIRLTPAFDAGAAADAGGRGGTPARLRGSGAAADGGRSGGQLAGLPPGRRPPAGRGVGRRRRGGLRPRRAGPGLRPVEHRQLPGRPGHPRHLRLRGRLWRRPRRGRMGRPRHRRSDLPGIRDGDAPAPRDGMIPSGDGKRLPGSRWSPGRRIRGAHRPRHPISRFRGAGHRFDPAYAASSATGPT